MYKRALSLAMFCALWYFIVIILLVSMVLSGTTDIFPWIINIFFAVAGIAIIKMCVCEFDRISAIKEHGKQVIGIIVNHTQDGTIYKNNKPMVALVVRYFDKQHAVQEIILPTGEYNSWDYPIGTGVKMLVYEEAKEAVLLNLEQNIPDELKSLQYLDKETSSNAVVRRQFVSCTCPKCGATLMIANHGTSKCEYCGNLISFDNFSQADDIYDVSVQGRQQQK